MAAGLVPGRSLSTVRGGKSKPRLMRLKDYLASWGADSPEKLERGSQYKEPVCGDGDG